MNRRVVVAGSGVFGLACAVTLAGLGFEILSLDPAPGGANASAVAAGMLAPTGEALFDPSAAPHHELMTHAFTLWPAFARETGVATADDGLVVPVEMEASLAALGVVAEPHALGLRVPVDSRVVAPRAALGALRARAAALGARLEARAAGVEDLRPGDVLVLATGAGALPRDLAPEAAHLRPVKGQIAVLPQGPAEGPVVRWPGGYLAPQPGGARVGATMEAGRADTRVEPRVIAGLVEAAQQRVPGLEVREAFGEAGVRMETPDGLPLVGPSRTPGVMLALGARRNGWLLAPLVASVIAAYCKGEDPGPWAAPLRPDRFDG